MDALLPKKIGGRLIVVHSTLPLSLKKQKLGMWTFHDRNLSALVSSITSLKEKKIIDGHLWVGCPTTMEGSLMVGETIQDREALNILLKENSCVSVDKVSPQLYDEACVQFSKNFLKPLFHYDISNSTFHNPHWKAYKEFNRIFARKIAHIYRPGDTIWVHGKELFLLPMYLRTLIPNSLVGFYLHCPFPAVEVYRCLSRRKKILQGLLGADLVAFQSYTYLRYFVQSCTRILGAPAGYDGVRYRNEKIGKDHLSHVAVYPEGIDPTEAQKILLFPDVQQRISELKETFKGKKILFAKDQAEAIEATKMKLLAFERFLRANPEWIGNVVFLLVCEPTKGDGKVMSIINETVARINGEFSRVGFIPIEYMSRHMDYEDICAFYYISDVFVSTPLREGMNLDTHDFVSCRSDNPGVLILSEFDGASRCFGGAISVNPWSLSQVSKSIHDALTLSSEEITIKHEYNLNYVLTNTSLFWGNAFIHDLFSSSNQFLFNNDPRLLDVQVLDQSYRLASKRLLVFDYEGTFSAISTKSEKLRSRFSLILKRLASDPKNTIYMVTSRDSVTMETILQDIPEIGLASEHGNFLKSSTGIPAPGQSGLDVSAEWKCLSEGADLSWIPIVQPILEFFAERTPGSVLDVRQVTLSWNYQQCTNDHSDNQAQELLSQLMDMSCKIPIDIIHSNKIIEIKPSGFGNGQAMQMIMQENSDLDFILCVGDERTDSKMFEQLDRENSSHFPITIGKSDSAAKYYVNSQSQAIRVMDHISSPLNNNNVSPIPMAPVQINIVSPTNSNTPTTTATVLIQNPIGH
ncbi:hypothetical protein DFA_05635 [Cavenderia fasciculata]|uniref:Glycosyltransferase n=1 Tax=Cavenderia fasciculata TaxID=261658 RepID=F4PLU8_CACFS|nr:uncharacterized protein DFA_05635 [Cavenderia fasciculata]EGG23502.1 hypothetical protein DFA_05635 [Cavenderia fasciculata]|eukprot:XP_004361353.1 hypothetical protein DFA_05635 [Cavenderia fasciculata]